MAKNVSRIQNGRRVLTPQEAEERGAIIVPSGALPAGIRKIKRRDLAKTLPREMVSKIPRICTECSTRFIETIIHPVGELPQPRAREERSDLCANCFQKLNHFPIIGAKKPRGNDVPRRI